MCGGPDLGGGSGALCSLGGQVVLGQNPRCSFCQWKEHLGFDFLHVHV